MYGVLAFAAMELGTELSRLKVRCTINHLFEQIFVTVQPHNSKLAATNIPNSVYERWESGIMSCPSPIMHARSCRGMGTRLGPMEFHTSKN